MEEEEIEKLATQTASLLLKTVIKIRENGLLTHIAETYALLRQELMTKGFSRPEAISIITSLKLK